ncbi:alpha-L-rhamnosidase C-terminal domain-containing protein [Paenibacillus montanisoli]|uniref:Uncharacterized protein n=1 Tax=Paenibacillus montanisoli TaxID=2081970 RepID=A0A328TSR5_9BACL|nr:family 78 glycoside hydrolase catalytic domain [Paenibacillus montanisoli]RAP73558.1 hypothetical protein DL346_25090 [Paenibacillus montanisoli]
MEDMRDWQAKWIWRQELPHARDHELVYFRRSFMVNGEGCKLTVHVSADSRYRLYLNGEPVSVGPCKGDAYTHYYETVDLSGKLLPGRNVLAAKALHYGGTSPWRMAEHGPVSVWRSEAGGFLLEGAVTAAGGELIERLDTDSSWRCLKDEGYGYVPVPMIQWAGGLESVDGEKQPQGWETSAYDDSHWPAAVPFYDVRNDWGELSAWPLEPRPIPPLYERTNGFQGITYLEGAAEAALSSMLGPASESATPQGLELPPNSRMVVELDAGQLTTGYIRLEMTGGQGAVLRLLCSECYEPENSTRGKRIKGIRNQTEGGKLMGEYDTYRVAGTGSGAEDRKPEAYEPFWFRTFRFIRLEIETGLQELSLTSIRYRETGYPLEVESEFDCSDPQFRAMWTMGIRTLQLCMHETYEDCPYYEQLQYTKDTRLMMRYQYGISADDRMARRALHDFHSSQLPSGMLQCRTPSMYTHIIPAFSFDWIYMLQEHLAYFGDLQLVRRYRPTVIALLDWFERKRTAEGLVGGMPPRYWTHFDWVNEWPGGAPPLPKDQPMTLHSLMYAAALNAAADLMQHSGWGELAAEYRDKATDVNEAVIRACWSEERQLFEDAPNSGSFSQHPQVWAVLSGLIEGDEARRLLRRALRVESLPVISLPMTYQLLRALDMTGLYDEIGTAYWERWRKFIGLELTTFPEEDIVGPRSDCHGWSALPLSEFSARILGVSPGAPGFERIVVRPVLGKLTWAKGKVATVKGPVSVEWRLEDGEFAIRVEGPNVPIELALPDGTTRAFLGKGQYSCGISKTSDHLHS